MNRRLSIALAPAFVAGLLLASYGISSSYAAPAHGTSPVLRAGSATVAGKHDTVVVDAVGRTVYWLTGDSPRHPKCSSASCLRYWPAVTAKGQHPTAGKGVKGKLGIWAHDRLRQVTLNGHPLYTYVGDGRPGQANGQGLASFGGTWYVELLASASSVAAGGPAGTSPTYTYPPALPASTTPSAPAATTTTATVPPAATTTTSGTTTSPPATTTTATTQTYTYPQGW